MSNHVQEFPEFSFAFQPIYDISKERVSSFEILLRGLSNESSASIFSKIKKEDLYAFDELLRVKAIALAATLGVGTNINLNLMPGSIFASETAISSVVDAARKYGLPLENITIEVTENEVINDIATFTRKINSFRSKGLSIAIDDFGAGYSGLNLLADFQPDKVKIDISIIRNIHKSGPRQAVCRGILTTCKDLGIDVIAEGVETKQEYDWCLNEGINYIQGYFVAKPGFEYFPLPFR